MLVVVVGMVVALVVVGMVVELVAGELVEVVEVVLVEEVVVVLVVVVVVVLVEAVVVLLVAVVDMVAPQDMVGKALLVDMVVEVVVEDNFDPCIHILHCMHNHNTQQLDYI